MKKKSIIVVLFSFLCLFPLYPQDYYWYKGKQVKLLIDSTKLNITIAKQQRETELNLLTKLDKYSAGLKLNQLEETDNQKLFSIDLESSKMYNDVVDLLKSNSNVVAVSPYFIRGENSSIGTSQFFYVQLHDINDYEKLTQFADKMSLEIVKQVPNIPDWYILSVTVNSEFNSVEMSNIAYETGLFVAVDPAFMFNFSYSCVNDPAFSYLWNLRNTVYLGMDIDICDAWNYTKGAGINVAVVDEGIDPNHNDLKSNFHPLSFDAQSGTSPSVFTGYPHGTHVAGIIAAIKDNNFLSVGVAPESKIMRVSRRDIVNSLISSQFASGISWAWQNGADVINCSWGDHGGMHWHNNGFAVNSALLENAIEDALQYGRAGNGCVVVFASGNESPDRIDYPGNSNEDIVVVGAIQADGFRWSSSAYGTELDVVAPGRNVMSIIPYDSLAYMSGTSMAAPHVSGIAALILSINPYLTQKEVADVIDKTAQKISKNWYAYSTNSNRDNGIWHEQMGYGLVNAYEAVKMAEETLCPPILTGTQPPPSSNYRLVECEEIHIQDATVPANTTLILDATDRVTINAGFKVEAGARFIVK